MTSERQLPVLIVGGGVVGLSASLCLSHHGIESLVVERRPGTSIHPRARSVNARTMELFRRFGIDEQVREAGASISPSMGIYRGRSLKEVIESKPRREGTRKLPFTGFLAPISPVIGPWVTQDQLEPLLVNAAKDRGGTIWFNSECTHVEQDEKDVRAIIKDRASGSEKIIQAQYLIVADGASSRIRNQLNVSTTGRGAMGHLLNILFKADLKSLVQNREFSLCVIDRPEVCGLFASINNSDRWVFQLSYDPSKGEKSSDFPNDRCIELLHTALGLSEAEIEIESVLPWEPSVRVVEKMRIGDRIFLAGDAAHQMPPWGGMGANTGILDVCNLAWKLAFVLREQAGRALLETYNEERLPVGREAAEASAMGADDGGLISVTPSWTVLRGWMRKAPLISGHGYGYSSRVICQEDTSPLRGWTWRPWTVPSLFASIDGRPGRRVPHFWVQHHGKRVSTLDLMGKNLVLLAGTNGTPWLDAVKKVSKILNIEMNAFRVGPDGDLVAAKNKFESAAGITPEGAILVRPDDFVVWRERRQPSDLAARIEQAARQALCL